jgi:hypothetical protein
MKQPTRRGKEGWGKESGKEGWAVGTPEPCARKDSEASAHVTRSEEFKDPMDTVTLEAWW